MYIGVARAGYSISEEVHMLALVFSLGLAALIVWWVLR